MYPLEELLKKPRFERIKEHVRHNLKTRAINLLNSVIAYWCARYEPVVQKQRIGTVTSQVVGGANSVVLMLRIDINEKTVEEVAKELVQREVEYIERVLKHGS